MNWRLVKQFFNPFTSLPSLLAYLILIIIGVVYLLSWLVPNQQIVSVQEQHRLASLRTILSIEEIESAILARDQTRLEQLIADIIASDSGIDWTIVTDANGQRLFEITRTQAFSQEETYKTIKKITPISWSVIHKVLAGETGKYGDKFIDTINIDDRELILTAGPVYQDRNNRKPIVGTIAVGNYIED